MRRPMKAKHGTGGVALAAVFTTLLASLVAARAPQGGTGASPRPLVPVSASTVVANPDAYYGQNVTLTAAVEQVLSRSAFSVDQRPAGGTSHGATSAGNDVLILTPTLYGAVEPNTYVTVFGEVVRFDPEAIARTATHYNLDLPPNIAAQYLGRPAVVATAVINAAMIDLVKRPMSAEERALSSVMKRVGPAFAALRDGIEESSAEKAAQSAAVLKQAFTETEAFWKARRNADATEWARDARKQVESIQRTVGSGNWNGVKASATSLGRACQTCHSAYRERFDDGTYRIKG